MTNIKKIQQFVEALQDVSVLCVGDIMLDHFVSGEVGRISPEAPVPVLRVRHKNSMLGGAGNVVRNLAALGVNPSFVSVIGNDEPGREVCELLQKHMADPKLAVLSSRMTTIKTRFMSGGQQLLRCDHETTCHIAPAEEDSLFEKATKEINGCDALVLSDYGKGVLTPSLIQKLIGLANDAGKPVVVDPKGRDYSCYKGATLMTPNLKELSEASGLPVEGDEQVVAAAKHIVDSCGIKAVLATRSQDGMTLVCGNGADIRHLTARAREVYDVSGAGDTVVAMMAAGLGAGLDAADAAELANIAGGIVVGKAGTAVVHAHEVVAAAQKADLLRYQGMGNKSKNVGLDAAKEKVEAWRRRGRTVGFTNGCFDLLHPGHISLIEQAAETCDRLIIGLNSDESVRRLKGSSRPVQSEHARATVLSSLSAVSLVVIFNEDTPLNLIENLRPDVLVKGADYTVETVVGADIVQSYGGKIVLAELKDGFSTTTTIARLNQKPE